VHNHITGKRDGEIIPQGTLCNHGGRVRFAEEFVPFGIEFGFIVSLLFVKAVVEDLEDEAVALFAILAGEGYEVFHTRGLERRKAVEFEKGLEDIEYIAAFAHFGG
jgi:hypothetical protein